MRNDVYRFKFRGFGQIDDAQKQSILDDYEQSQRADLLHYEQAQHKLAHEMNADPTYAEHYLWAVNTIDLQIKNIQAHLEWVVNMRQALAVEE